MTSNLKKYFIMLLGAFFASFITVSAQNLTIDSDFPGGNVLVNNIDNTSSLYYNLSGDTAFVQPDLRDTNGNWFYWFFRVTKSEGRKIHFKFPGNYIGAFGPAFSIDSGKTWNWLYDQTNINSSCFDFTFVDGQKEVLFSSVIPYLHTDFESFVSRFRNSKFVNIESLATSKKGRNIEKLIIKHPSNKTKYKVLLTARHHACEVMASYALEGIIESIVDGKSSSMEWLRENVEFFIVPFMDKDGVEDGDQGKNRMPWDHLSDYSGISIYKSTEALRKQISGWAKNDLMIVLDLHCPGLRGKWAETIFIVEAKDKTVASGQQAFMEVLQGENDGELTLHPTRSIIENGTAWNVSKEGEIGLGFREWASNEIGVPVAATMEIPYANNNGQMVLPENARVFGKDISKGIAVYLQSLESK